MYYIIGDIHGYFHKFINLFQKIKVHLKKDDTLVFLGDYIDRGEYSYEVIDFLLSVQRSYNAVFLKGNHEAMLLDYLNPENTSQIYMYNGGDKTIRSYKRNTGSSKLPDTHLAFFKSLQLYYETDDFIAVHAGLNPKVNSLEEQTEGDMIWIRDKFFRSTQRWEKTVIFGHTPTHFISPDGGVIIDKNRNFIAIDSGVIYNKHISCVRWPDKLILTSE